MEATNQEELGLEQLPREYAIASVKLAGGASSLQPARRGGATLTQVGENGAVYLVGGANREAASFGDVHRFDLDAGEWTLVTPTSGSLEPRSGHSAVAIGAKIYVFGGLDAIAGAVYNDVRIFDTRTSSWNKPEVEGQPPLPRNAHAAIVLPEDHETTNSRRMLVHGGSSPDCGALADLFLLHIPIDGADDAPARLRWEKLSAVGEHPEARELHCALMQTESTVCFAGGRNHDGKVCTDMVLLDLDRWKWQLVPMCEWNRCSLAAGVVDGELLSFGGWDGGRICGDCWRYRDDEESWLPVNVVATESKQAATEPSTTASPEIEARFGHCGTTVTMHSPSELGEKTPFQALLVFGGMNAHSDLNDLVLITPNQHSHT